MNKNNRYICPICGTLYDTAREMAECIVKCDEKRKAEEAVNERKKLEEERRKDLEEIKNTNQLLHKQKKDYYAKYHENPYCISKVLSNKDFEDLAKEIIGIRW